ncbi:MAG TPA: hypothetical protein VEX69_09030 [Candidatus Limnocylindria bacterium]|nr:hypothetical protein [Candidatus Limnocylindria bacterium]
MAARQCPNCMTMVPAGEIAAHSYDLTCPGCQRPLEISDFSRNLASFGALAVAALVWAFAASRFSADPSALGWIMPLLYGYLALSVAAPLLLISLADLRLSSESPAPVVHEAPAHHSSH